MGRKRSAAIGSAQGVAGTPAVTALARAGIPYAVHAFEHDPDAPSYGLEAAAALGVAPFRVLKTLLVDGDGGLAVGIVPVDRTLDLKRLASALGRKKVVMAEPAVAEKATGYVVGGISPIGQRRRLPTVLDSAAATHPSVLVSAGRRGLDIELSPQDLLAITGGSVAPIARD